MHGEEVVWAPMLRRALFPRVSQLLEKLQTLHIDRDLEDRRTWRVALGVDFSVKSYYGFIANHRMIMGPEIWYNGIPLKVQFFMWTAVLEKISTMDLLWSKGFNMPSVCLLCYQDTESTSHLLLHCPFSWEI